MARPLKHEPTKPAGIPAKRHQKPAEARSLEGLADSHPTQTPTLMPDTKKIALARFARSESADGYYIAQRNTKRPVGQSPPRPPKNANVLVPRTPIRQKDFVVAWRPQCYLYGPRIYIHYRLKLFLQYLGSRVSKCPYW